MTPLCEVCGREPAVSASWFADRSNWYGPWSGTWKLAGLCSTPTEQYYIFLPDLLARLDRWREHLIEKTWFDPNDFEALLGRYQVAAGSLEVPRLRVAKGNRSGRYRANTKPRAGRRPMPSTKEAHLMPNEHESHARTLEALADLIEGVPGATCLADVERILGRPWQDVLRERAQLGLADEMGA